jgi:hypothetical protein
MQVHRLTEGRWERLSAAEKRARRIGNEDSEIPQARPADGDGPEHRATHQRIDRRLGKRTPRDIRVTSLLAALVRLTTGRDTWHCRRDDFGIRQAEGLTVALAAGALQQNP